jgi:hypothetical protein
VSSAASSACVVIAPMRRLPSSSFATPRKLAIRRKLTSREGATRPRFIIATRD